MRIDRNSGLRTIGNRQSKIGNRCHPQSAIRNPHFRQGALPLAAVKYGELSPAGDAALHLPRAGQGYQLDLRVTLEKSGQVVNTNHWSFWAFAEVGPEVRALARPENAGSIISSGVFLRLGKRTKRETWRQRGGKRDDADG
jgi:hypothetical protein